MTDQKKSIKHKSSESVKMRLNKYISHSGVCSRRKAAELVKAGKIYVNGEIEVNPAIEVSHKDSVTYQGKLLKPEINKVYYLLNKPKGVITTASDEKNRKTVLDIISEKVKERIYPVGRLDRNTSGLLILTNDGDLAEKLSHPKYNVQKVYQVILNKKIKKEHLDQIRTGITLEDGFIKPDGVNFLTGKDDRNVGIELHSGKNRIVRRIFEHFEYEILGLDRIYYAGLSKKDLSRGRYRTLTKKEIIMLKHFI
jgi:23S rRNA pseudouridine2605 synthase